jgi:hypothetical protein
MQPFDFEIDSDLMIAPNVFSLMMISVESFWLSAGA